MYTPPSSKRSLRVSSAGSPYRRVVNKAVATAARAASAWAVRSLTGTSTSNSTSATRAITSQHDVKTTYKKKRMPKYKRKRWVKFLKKVQAVDEVNQGLQKVIFNDGGNYVTSNIVSGKRQQAVFGSIIYSGNGTPDTSIFGVSDIQRVINAGAPSSMYPSLASAPVGNSTKYKFTSAVMDYTITSDATNTCALEVDVYMIRFRKGWGNVTGSNSLSGMVNYYTNKEETLGSTGTGARALIYYRGVTPFECSNALSSMGIMIKSKSKYYIAPGNSINLNLRDAKSHYCEPDDPGDGSQGLAFKNWTQGFFCIAKPTRDLAADASFTILTGCTRTYKYQVSGWVSQGTQYLS